MQWVILAAGSGRRLKSPMRPKTLTQLVSEESILERLLRQIHSLGGHVTLVVGFKKEMITKQYPKLSFVDNPAFASTNTATSLALALKETHQDDDLIFLNGDIVVKQEVLERLAKCNKTTMVVTKESAVGEEEVKYKTAEQDRIVAVSKEVHGAEGEAVGINRIMAKDLPLLISALKECKETDYFEKGIELAIHKGLTVSALCIDASACVEIDFVEDLERANALLKEWGEC